MNILSLCDGMSCLQIAMKELGIKIDKYYASEIDKFAIKQTQHNFPNTIQIGSIVDIDVSKLDKIDFIGGGTPCFGAGTKILTNLGYKNIENIEIGDLVLTHKNRYRRVLDIGSKISRCYTLRAHGFVDTIVTHDHPYYARKKMFVWDNLIRSKQMILDKPKWVKASDLSGNYYIGLNVPTIEENPLNITEEEAFILGRYIADGHTRKGFRKGEGRPNDRIWELVLSIGENKINNFNVSIKHSICKHSESVYRVIFYNKRLVQIAEQHCGCGALNKYFSETLINLPCKILKKMLDGYLSGDGYFANNGWNITTISSVLPLSLQRVVAKLYHKHVNITFNNVECTHVICGRNVHQHDQYLLRFSEISKRFEKYRYEDSIIWTGVKSFEEYQYGTVYNIEVEEDNSYTANNAIVHNCTNFSFAGKRQGMSTTENEEIYTLERYLELKDQGFEFEGESYLFWEFMRILKDVQKYNPDVLFLLENVEMGKKWERVLSEAVGVYGVHINSALVSAQNRKRIYWSNIQTKREGLFGELHTDIPQPEDRGILLKDILEDVVDEKYYLSDKMIECITNRVNIAKGYEFKPTDGWVKSNTIVKKEGNYSTSNFVCVPCDYRHDEGIRFKADGKTGTLLSRARNDESCGQMVCVAMRGRNTEKPSDRITGSQTEQQIEPGTDGKTNTLTTVQKDNLIIQLNPSNESGGKQPYQQNRIYDFKGKSPAHMAKMSCNSYAIKDESNIRRLTPTECARLQTIPEWYEWGVSDSQAYKMLGNAWTIEVIKHILKYMQL